MWQVTLEDTTIIWRDRDNGQLRQVVLETGVHEPPERFIRFTLDALSRMECSGVTTIEV